MLLITQTAIETLLFILLDSLCFLYYSATIFSYVFRIDKLYNIGSRTDYSRNGYMGFIFNGYFRIWSDKERPVEKRPY